MKPLTIPKDTSVFLGRPAKPMPQALSDAITELVRSIVGIREAYLPQCYVKTIVEPPAQILVLVLDEEADHVSLLDTVGQGLERVLPEGLHLDVWPLGERDSLLATVRGTQTQIHCEPPPEKKSWWKLFS